VVGNFALVDTAVRVTGGAAHPTDSTVTAFKTAAVLGLREALLAARPVLLEPVMALDVVTPEPHLGDVLGDLNARRARVRDLATEGDRQVIRADAPLAELFGYATALRSLTRGRASYTMEPKEFDVVPEALLAGILHR